MTTPSTEYRQRNWHNFGRRDCNWQQPPPDRVIPPEAMVLKTGEVMMCSTCGALYGTSQWSAECPGACPAEKPKGTMPCPDS